MNEQRRDALPPGARLDGDKYAIEEVLGSGGFGLVYRVRHLLLDEERAIKEYLPSEIAVREGETVYARSSGDTGDYRDGLDRFLKEARQLVRFDGHPNIIRCRDYFEANGTAYLVMDFEDGLPLDTFLARREDQGQPLTEAELRHLLRPLLEGLAHVHAEDVLHRDIKPGNVFVRRRDGQPVLLDFGAAKEDFSKHSRSRAPHTPGYAAPEQVEDECHLGPWTDLYAVGALMWRAVTGSPPPKVESRLSALRPGRTDPLVIDEGTGGGRFSADLLAVMRECLHLDEAQRPPSAKALLALLEGEGLEPAPEPEPVPNPAITTARRAVGGVFRDALSSGGEGPEMVVLPTGRFRMGDLSGDGNEFERPVHTVTISRPIAMGRYPVTFEDYDRYAENWGFLKALFGKKPSDWCWGRGRRPVINVNWHDAKAYAAWLSKQTGKRYRLPSESEWEYAARAGTETAYSWGNEIGVNRANCDGSGSEWSNKQTSPVGSFEPNAFGLYDMHGNVWECVEDCWHENYESAPSDGSARTSGGDSSLVVVRGGCWKNDPRDLRSAYRSGHSPSSRLIAYGVRLVQDLNP